jgi:hypothetical protein
VKVAFVIHRLSFYRHLGPIIDRALESGWQVECWHDQGFPTTEAKRYLFADSSAAPRFFHGQPDVQSYGGPAELVERLDRGDVDVVVSISTRDLSTVGVPLRGSPPWVCVQSGPDTFKLKTESLESCDLLALCSPWWLEWGLEQYGTLGETTDIAALTASLEARSRYVGYPAADAARLVDRAEVRRKWGMSPDQPVVVLLPFPQGGGRRNFWPKKIFTEPSRMRRMLNVLAHGQLAYAGEAWGGTNDVDVMRAVRAFCDRQGAFLLVKSREKTPIPDYVRAAADMCVYDESYYPSTIIEALSVASLCISHYSLGVLEAAALGVPNLCIASRAEDYFGKHGSPSDILLFEGLFNRRPGGVFEFGSVSRTFSASETIEALSGGSLEDFRMNDTDRVAYEQRFLGDNDGRASARTMNDIAELAGLR